MSKAWDYCLILMPIMNAILMIFVEHESALVKVLIISLNGFMWLFIALYFDLKNKTKTDTADNETTPTHY